MDSISPNLKQTRGFLAGLSQKERKALLPQIREQAGALGLTFYTRPRPELIMALFGCGDWKDVSRIFLAEWNPEVVGVLADRRPKWIDKWINQQLGRMGQLCDWEIVRKYEREGVWAPEHSDAYWLCLLWKCPGDRLEPELVWDLLASPAIHHADQVSWSRALARMAEAGALPRLKLLDHTLSVLSVETTTTRRLLTDLHAALQPSLDEMAPRWSRYAALVMSATPGTATFAIKELAALHRGGRLPLGETARLLDGCWPKLKKTVALQLATLLKSESDFMAQAVHSPYAEVQRQVPAPSKVAAEAAPAAVVPRERKTIQPLTDLDDVIETFMAVLEPSASGDDVERVLDGITRHPQPDRRAAALQKRASEIVEGGAPFDGTNPQADLAAVALAWTDKRVLRSPFLKPLLDWLKSEMSDPPPYPHGPTDFIFMSLRLYFLAAQLATGRARPLLSAPTHQHGWIEPRVFAERLRSNPDNISKTDMILGLLRLAPQHREEFFPIGREGPYLPYRLAAYRSLHPFGTDYSLPVEGPDGGVAAHYAIDPKQAPPLDGQEQMRWRAQRYQASLRPIESLPPVLRLSLENAYRSLGQPLPTSIPMYDGLHSRELVATNPLPPGRIHPLHPTVLFHTGSGTRPCTSWDMTIWPSNRQPLYALEACRLADHLESSTASWSGDWSTLLDADEPLGPMGTFLVTLALTARPPQVWQQAVDVAIAAITDERLHADMLIPCMQQVFEMGYVTMVRWQKAFQMVAAASARHREVMCRSVEGWIGRLPAGTHPPYELMEHWHEWCQASGARVTDGGARAFLESLQSGHGKTAKLAGRLLS